MVHPRVGSKLRIRADLKDTWASCQLRCRSLSYLATEMAAFVMPMTIGVWAGATGRGLMVSVPPGECERLSVELSHSVSVRISVSRPVGSTMVALLAAKFSTLTFHVR